MTSQSMRTPVHTFCLPRRSRLTSPRDFARIRAIGRRAGGRWLSVQIGRGGGQSRFGLVVGRRVGNAVERNRVKRRVREWFRHNLAVLPQGVDIVVIAREGAAQRSASEIDRELAVLVLERAR